MGQANLIVPIALLVFIPATVAAVSRLGLRRGVLAALVGGWLFLPVYDRALDIPWITRKAMFVPAVVLAVAVLQGWRDFWSFRPRLLDIPMLVLCLTPFATSISNGLGAYDGAHAAFQTTLSWGVPYLLGRVYLGSPRALDDLATTLVMGAIVYVPFCLWEVRMSPTLHHDLYGFATFQFVQSVRLGGYRPAVFLVHGLMLGMFMACSTLIAYWFWRLRGRDELWGVSMGWWLIVLLVTTLLTKSTGAILLLLVGIGALEGTRLLGKPLTLMILLAIPPGYCVARATGWNGLSLVDVSRNWLGAERAQSLSFRIQNEDKLIEKASERPWLGWGRWGRSRVYDARGRDISVTDGEWIIALGVLGLSGLVSLWLVLQLPVLALLRTFPARHWGDRRLASAAALAAILLLWAIDELLNAMNTPLFPAIAGALVSFSLVREQIQRPSSMAAQAPGSSVLRRRSSVA